MRYPIDSPLTWISITLVGCERSRSVSKEANPEGCGPNMRSGFRHPVRTAGERLDCDFAAGRAPRADVVDLKNSKIDVVVESHPSRTERDEGGAPAFGASEVNSGFPSTTVRAGSPACVALGVGMTGICGAAEGRQSAGVK